MSFASFMDLALQEARAAGDRGEVPVGAVLVSGGKVVARAGNRTLELNDPSAHAEILVIREACRQMRSQRLPAFDLYVTLEPCTMCAGAISFARIRRLYFGAEDTKGGAVIVRVRFFDQSTCHHKPDTYSGLAPSDSETLSRESFAPKRHS